MFVYTSYFSYLRHNSVAGIPVAITRWPPRFFKGSLYRTLAPSKSLIKAWKNGRISEDQYIHIYYRETLMGIHPQAVLNELLEITDGQVPILLCFEKKGDFCHRHIAGRWLSQCVRVEEA